MKHILMFLLGWLVLALLAWELIRPLLHHQEVNNAKHCMHRALSDWSQGDNGR
jgi:hypothetical protein